MDTTKTTDDCSSERVTTLNLDAILPAGEMHDLAFFFRTKAREAQEIGDTNHETLYRTLAAATQLPWHPDERDAFGDPALIDEPLLFANHQLRDEVVERFRKVLANLTHPLLRARLADILWSFKKDVVSARAAVTAYFDYAKLSDNTQDWMEPVYALTRALSIARSLGKKNEQLEELLNYVEGCVQREDGQDTLLYSNRLIHLLRYYHHSNLARVAQYAENLALTQAGQKNDAFIVAQHWVLTALCHRQAKNIKAAEEATKRSAEVWVDEATKGLAQPNFALVQVGHWLEKAIAILRSVPNTKERVAVLREQLEEVQEKSTAQFATFNMDLENNAEAKQFREDAANAVRGSDFLGSLLALARVSSSPPVDKLYQKAQEDEKNYLLKQFFPTKIVDATGRNVANPPETREGRWWADVFQAQNLYRQGLVEVKILPAQRELLEVHPFTLLDLAPIVEDNPLIPIGHEYSVLRGLLAGLRGDFLTAAHLLTPQLEATCRHILAIRGVNTSNYSSDGIQDAVNLNTMLEDETFLESLSEVLNRDTVFDLRGLLVDRFGANFRNNFAHGLLSDGQFFGAQSIYLWHLALNIYSRPFLLLKIRSETAKKESTKNS